MQRALVGCSQGVREFKSGSSILGVDIGLHRWRRLGASGFMDGLRASGLLQVVLHRFWVAPLGMDFGLPCKTIPWRELVL